MQVDVKRLERLVTAIRHDECDVVPTCFHHVSDKGVAKAVTGKAVGPPIIQSCDFPGFATGPRNGVVEGCSFRARKQPGRSQLIKSGFFLRGLQHSLNAANEDASAILVEGRTKAKYLIELA